MRTLRAGVAATAVAGGLIVVGVAASQPGCVSNPVVAELGVDGAFDAAFPFDAAFSFDASGDAPAHVDAPADAPADSTVGDSSTLDSAVPDSSADGPTGDSSTSDAGTDAAEAGQDAGEDAGEDAGLDAGEDAGVDGACPSFACSGSTGPDASVYDSYCSATCNGFAISCQCVSDSPGTCFCATGNAAPDCLTGTLASCGDPTTCSADLSSDPANCGRCGHSCGSLTCTGGVCQSLTLNFGGTPQPAPDDWASDGTYIYSVSCGERVVVKTPIGGLTDGGTSTVLASGTCPSGIGIDTTNAYWVEGTTGQVWYAPLSGTGTAQVLGSTGQARFTNTGLNGMAMDENTLYFDIEPQDGYSFVYSLSKTGGTPTVLSNDGYIDTTSIAVDTNNVYYITFNESDGQLRSVPKGGVGDGGSSTILATFPGDQVHQLLLTSSAILVNGTNVYSVPIGGGDGGAGTVIVLGQQNMNPQAIATDGTTLFFTDFIDGFVYEQSLAGGYAQRVAIGQNEPDLILLDANNLYWTSNYGGFWSLPNTYRP